MKSLTSSSGCISTTCSYCGVGCGISIKPGIKGNLLLEGDTNYPVNQGMLCSKGRNLHYTVTNREDRLLHPQMRWSKQHPLRKVSWEEAMKRAAAVFRTFIEKYGPDSVGFYVSGQCLTEEYYLVNKLVKGYIGTNNVDTNSRLCMSSAVVGYKKTLGDDLVPVAYEDIELSDCILISGANPAWCHPIIFRRIERHMLKNPHVKLIVVDPRRTESCELATLHLQINPGTDTLLNQGIGRFLIEQGMIDEAFIREHTNGFEFYRKEVMTRTIREYASLCGIPVQDLEDAARMIGTSSAFLSLWAMGLNQSTDGVNKNLSLINLNLITGQIGRPGAGPFSLTGQPNAMGGREVGGMANLLAAHLDLADDEHRAQVARFWKVPRISEKPGLTATQMFEALETGDLKAIWIICTNPAVSMPNANRMEKALANAPFVVVQDISSRSDTAAFADLLLPAAGWGEKEGTMTNAERRISYLPKVTDAPGEALPDSEILLRFARQMNFEGFHYSSIGEVFDEHCRLTRDTPIDISGLSYERLKNVRSIQWPVPSEDHPGTIRLFEDHQFATADGRANICTTGKENNKEELHPEFPLILTTGRIRDQWHTMTRTGKVSRLNKHQARPFLEIHPDDAADRQISNGAIVRIHNGRGEVCLPARVTDVIKKGVVFLPMHWGKILNSSAGRANNLTTDRTDPLSKQPGFKFAAVQVERHLKKRQKIIVIGAGAAAYRFINTYRNLNLDDEIVVFSREENPFYNRVLLPDYVNGRKQWTDLLKTTDEELKQMRINILSGVEVCSIDRSQQSVTDSNGEIHHYDILIMATGSEPFLPPGVPVHLTGVMTMRSRPDAEKLMQQVDAGDHAIIVGGGLLGLEMASSLREIDVHVSLIQLGPRLMQRQLDPMGSTLLREYVEQEGIHVYSDDEVMKITPLPNNNLSVELKSGRFLKSRVVIYAVGTRPNIRLAQDAGLDCKRGVTVDQYMQTSDLRIFALGEIAEFNEQTMGITAAAEKQADICARYICGDRTEPYSGSIPMNILKFPSFELCSMGLPEIPANQANFNEILFIDREQLYYKKCIIHQDKLVGAILIGDKSEFAEFRELIESGTELSEKRMQLLRSGEKSDPPRGPIVCSCNNVGAMNLEDAMNDGFTELDSLCRQTGAGLGCGSCKPEIRRMLSQFPEVAAV